ncbi:MAG: glucose-1-phosphate adenylyltransferase subunit GlgD [Clostridia bacterium]
MKDTMGIILAENSDIRLNELTDVRSVAALPFGGRYRLIDFILSNMVNSGIINVGVTTLFNYSSLMDHVGSGNPWDLDRKTYGLFFLPPYIRGGNAAGISNGSVDLLYGVLTHLRRSPQKYVLLAGGNLVCNMTFDEALYFHEETEADVTVIYNNLADNPEQLKRTTVYEINDENRVIGIEHNPRTPKTSLSGMDMYIVERTRLISMIEEAYAKGSHDFIKDVLLANLNSLNIYAYEYKGFVGRVDNIKSYYENSMLMLDESVRRQIFGGENLIYTKVKDQVPTQYGENANVSDSLIADGCRIDGTVENSIIFRGVRVGKGTVIRNSIVMQNTVIDENCDLENVVIDKECTLRPLKRLIGQPNYPVILPKRTMI